MHATLCYAMCALLCMLCYAMLCYAMLCYAMLCYAMLCYAMLCYAMLCYAMLCFALLCLLCYALGEPWPGVWGNRRALLCMFGGTLAGGLGEPPGLYALHCYACYAVLWGILGRGSGGTARAGLHLCYALGEPWPGVWGPGWFALTGPLS